MDSLFLKSEVLLASYWQIIHSKDIICHFTCSYIKNMIFETVFFTIECKCIFGKKDFVPNCSAPGGYKKYVSFS